MIKNFFKKICGFMNPNDDNVIRGTIHDYTNRYWGHDYTITDVIDGGQQLIAMGWGHGLRVGDFIKIQNKDSTTHYRIDEIEYMSDPSDMWDATLIFPKKVSKKTVDN